MLLCACEMIPQRGPHAGPEKPHHHHNMDHVDDLGPHHSAVVLNTCLSNKGVNLGTYHRLEERYPWESTFW